MILRSNFLLLTLQTSGDILSADLERQVGMKYLVREKVVQPLTELSWRISEKPEFATLASAYVLLLAVRQGASFPLPDVNVILEREKGLPLYVVSAH